MYFCPLIMIFIVILLVLFSAKPAAVLERARTAVQEGRLYRCLFCKALCELQVEDKWFANSSAMCSQLLQSCKRVQHEQYNFMYQGKIILCVQNNE